MWLQQDVWSRMLGAGICPNHCVFGEAYCSVAAVLPLSWNLGLIITFCEHSSFPHLVNTEISTALFRLKLFGVNCLPPECVVQMILSQRSELRDSAKACISSQVCLVLICLVLYKGKPHKATSHLHQIRDEYTS